MTAQVPTSGVNHCKHPSHPPPLSPPKPPNTQTQPPQLHPTISAAPHLRAKAATEGWLCLASSISSHQQLPSALAYSGSLHTAHTAHSMQGEGGGGGECSYNTLLGLFAMCVHQILKSPDSSCRDLAMCPSCQHSSHSYSRLGWGAPSRNTCVALSLVCVH